ncbi:MAG: hypothetical protein HON14_16000 [Rhodospirillaceae bacterium]|jgi:hypothetical protein|nr:hypothetical protein [Rhodospirillaceae bacterium]
MLGLFTYTFCSVGLGGLFAQPSMERGVWFGLRGFVGFCSIAVLAFLLNTIAELSLLVTWGIVVMLSAIGWLKLAARFRANSDHWLSAILHPAIVFIGLGFAIAAWRGGIWYFPFSGDEFSQWIGTARAIFLAGGYPDAFNLIAYPNFTTGWAMTLLFPMIPFGIFDEGLAATAPFVMYAFLMGFIFEVLTHFMARYTPLNEKTLQLYAWAAVLMLITAEINGRLVSVNLLIEPVQIYTGSAIFLLILLMFDGQKRDFVLPALIGFICMSSYLYKMAALTLAPSLALSALGIFWINSRNEAGTKFLQALPYVLIAFAIMVAPMALVHLVWKSFPASSNCLAAPFALLDSNKLLDLLSDENVRIADLFMSKLWVYVSSYKWPLSIIALGAFAVGGINRKLWPVILAFMIYFVAMEAAFYLVMAICQHSQYMTTERYTRVLLQPGHVLGIMIVALLFMRQAASRDWSGFYRFLNLRWARASTIVMIIALFAWQVVSVHQALADLQYRHIQKIDVRHHKVRDAMVRLRDVIGTNANIKTQDRRPKILLIDDYWENLSDQVAMYYALGSRMGAKHPFAKIETWNRQITGASEGGLVRLSKMLRDADIVWPISVVPGAREVLNAQVDGETCGGDVEKFFFVRSPGEELRFTCFPKIPSQ